MSQSNRSKFLLLSKKYKFLKKVYFFYNIYIRNYKFLKNGSQFGEDKYILSHFDKDYKGKFLDVGCFHPTRHNNTYLMYNSGWSGINIDLNPLSIDFFNFARPRDININSAISNKEEEQDLYFIDELNTQNTLEKNQTSFLKNIHNIKEEEITKKKIKTIKLEKVLDENQFYEIDFMNLDIEGHELKVLRTINFKKVKIKYLCVEMINHNSFSIENNNEIENLLKMNNFSLIKKFGFNYIYKKIKDSPKTGS